MNTITPQHTLHHPLIAIVMGSKTDAHVMSASKEVLIALEIPYEARVVSAHRTPKETIEFITLAEKRGIKVIIAGAGASAALPGFVAAHTLLPVIGVPLSTTTLGGLDALLAIAQMPSGIPVATMAIDMAGAKNAALYAARILSLYHPEIAARLITYTNKVYQTAQENTLIDPFTI
jgi:5-(carboxyamino)imidazole ribonucleotide mutase